MTQNEEVVAKLYEELEQDCRRLERIPRVEEIQAIVKRAVDAERERCILLTCFDCRNYPERRLVYRPGKGWMHELIGGNYLCRASAIKEDRAANE